MLYRFYNQGVPVGEAGVNAMTTPTTEFVTFAQTQTAVAYANPSTTPATITITALDASGAFLATGQATLASHAHGAANVGSLLGLSSFSGSVQITSTAPIVSLSLNAEAFPAFSALPPGDLPSSTVLAKPAPQSSVTNVSGSIYPLYPCAKNIFSVPCFGGASTTGPVSFSVLLTVAAAEFAFDILPNAKPFTVQLVGPAATATIDIDPVRGTWQAILPVLTPAARALDFSTSEFTPVLDFLTCAPNGTQCSTFPGNRIPVVRYDPLAVYAQDLVPLATTASAKANTTTVKSGTLSGSHVDTTSSFLGFLPAMGAYMQIPYSPSSQTATFSLYIDGTLVDSKEVTYSVL